MSNRRSTVNPLSRRDFLKSAVTGGALFTGAAAGWDRLRRALGPNLPPADLHSQGEDDHGVPGGHGSMGAVGAVPPDGVQPAPLDMLSDFDYGRVSQLENGQTLREYDVVAYDRELEIAPGVFFPPWP